MPELAELRLTADYINGVTSGVTFDDVQKSPEHKGAEVGLHSDQFRISAESRGKELMIHIDHLSEPGEKLLMTMGMSGHFQWAMSACLCQNTLIWLLLLIGEYYAL